MISTNSDSELTRTQHIRARGYVGPVIQVLDHEKIMTCPLANHQKAKRVLAKRETQLCHAIKNEYSLEKKGCGASSRSQVEGVQSEVLTRICLASQFMGAK